MCQNAGWYPSLRQSACTQKEDTRRAEVLLAKKGHGCCGICQQNHLGTKHALWHIKAACHDTKSFCIRSQSQETNLANNRGPAAQLRQHTYFQTGLLLTKFVLVLQSAATGYHSAKAANRWEWPSSIDETKEKQARRGGHIRQQLASPVLWHKGCRNAGPL